MEVRILKREGNELVIEIQGEDHTIGNLLAKEALLDPRVEYSAYRIPHPLQERMELTIVTKQGEDPLKVLVEIIDKLVGDIRAFRSLVEEKL
ncbi:DNA-directed RNA polymerase subunit L [Thermogladius sp. KZ2Tp1]|jgi:DNA-directed RNA polymerase subunit L|uniref:RpoL/Rpb11 RNA polymerase subunit family protein n=1 Tax=unclassified Thermogladius TaxID=2647734 RepID=UPI003D0A9B91